MIYNWWLFSCEGTWNFKRLCKQVQQKHTPSVSPWRVWEDLSLYEGCDEEGMKSYLGGGGEGVCEMNGRKIYNPKIYYLSYFLNLLLLPNLVKGYWLGDEFWENIWHKIPTCPFMVFRSGQLWGNPHLISIHIGPSRSNQTYHLFERIHLHKLNCLSTISGITHSVEISYSIKKNSYSSFLLLLNHVQPALSIQKSHPFLHYLQHLLGYLTEDICRLIDQKHLLSPPWEEDW